MNQVMDKAKELGQAIESSPEMQSYRELEKKLLSRDLLELYLTYEQAKLMTLSENIPHNTRQEAEQIVEKHKHLMEHDEDIVAFREAELRINDLVAQVNSVILHFCDVPGKGHNCSGCSGCGGN